MYRDSRMGENSVNYMDDVDNTIMTYKIPDMILNPELIKLEKERYLYKDGVVSVGEYKPVEKMIHPGLYRLVNILQSPFLVPVEHSATKKQVIKYLKGLNYKTCKNDRCYSRSGWIGFLNNDEKLKEIKLKNPNNTGCPCSIDKVWKLNNSDLSNDLNSNDSPNKNIGAWIHSLSNPGDSSFVMYSEDGKSIGVLSPLLRHISHKIHITNF